MTDRDVAGEPRMTDEAVKPTRRRGAGMNETRDSRLHVDREAEEREVVEDREISDDERLEMFRDSLQQSVLPDIPKIPGYHVCWLSTTNGRDSIARRRQLGYELIRVEDLPGWDDTSVREGDYAGCICVNEMIASKIPLRLYNRMMRMVGHDMPLEEEGKLKVNIDALKQSMERDGTRVAEVGDGTTAIVQRARPMPEMTE